MKTGEPSNSDSQRLSQQIQDRIRSQCRRPASLRCFSAVVQACDFLEKNQVVITIAQVGALTSSRSAVDGRLKPQSIRNNPDFAGYIRARASEQKPVVRTDADWRSIRTGDVTVDAHIQALEGEVLQLKGELKTLRSAIPRLGEYDLQSVIEQRKLVLMEVSNNAPRPALIHALRKVLDPHNLRKVGLEMVPTGQIAAPDLANAIFLGKQEVDELRAFVQASERKPGVS